MAEYGSTLLPTTTPSPQVQFLLAAEEGQRSRSASLSRPLSRIPTRPELKTLTRVVKRPAIDIEFNDLTYTVQTATSRKHIIKNINGFFKSGQITCIMGPSGAGKSSLMNILAGYVSNGVGGTIYTNGAERQLALFNKLSAYIMQEDLLQPHLTVFESLLIAAHLKLGSELNPDEKRLAVEEIMETLNLKFCRNTRVEKLSGGQRKRVAVALELVNNPPVIFLDEPTTGLDIVTTTQVVTLMKSLARQGRTIVCTLHQPSSTIFHMLDHIYLLAKGQCIYQGSSHQLVPFLAKSGYVCKSTYNPADYVFEIINKSAIKILSCEIQNGKISLCEEEIDNETINTSKICRMDTVKDLLPVTTDSSLNAEMIFPTSFFQQWWILFCRMLLQQSRNMTAFWIQFLAHSAVGIMLGGIYTEVGNDAARPFDNFKYLISVTVFIVYTQVMRNVMMMPGEIKLLRREYFNRWYGLKAHFVACTMASVPFVIFFSIIFSSISYIMSNQPLNAERFLWFSVSTVLSALISEAMGLCIGSTFNAANGTVVTPAAVAPMLAVAVYGMGFGTAVEPYMLFLMSMSYIRHSLSAFALSLWGDNREYFKCPHEREVYCSHEDPKVLLRDIGMINDTLSTEIYILLGFLLLFKVLGYLLLKYRLSKDKSSGYNSSILSYFKKVIKKS